MRSIIKILLLAAYIATSCMTQAQNNRQQLTREQLAEVQAKHIAKETGMDDATSKRFINTYCDFQKEIWALNPKKRIQHRDMDEKETGQAIQNRFEHSQKILDIREKYYGIYSEFLTQKQIERVYKLERQMMRRLAEHGNRPGRQKR